MELNVIFLARANTGNTPGPRCSITFHAVVCLGLFDQDFCRVVAIEAAINELSASSIAELDGRKEGRRCRRCAGGFPDSAVNGR